MSAHSLWWRLVPAYAAGYYLSYALRNVNAVISPELSQAFALSQSHLGLLTAAYFLAFGAIQLPLGVWLDRYGPRRVEVALLIVAAAGCAVFGLAQNLETLVLGRALIGLGVSACLMASFKAFSQWFPPERLPALNASIMVAGGIGVLSVSTPVAWALPFLGWRGLFGVIGLALLLAAAAISRTPDGPTSTPPPWDEQWRILKAIYRHPDFWRYAPQGALVAGGAMALQGLWMVPWLMGVNGMTREEAAHIALIVGVTMLSGFLMVATLSNWLHARGWTAPVLLRRGIALGLVAELCIIMDLLPPVVAWPMFGFSFSLTNIAYSLLCRSFEVHWAGRVNTALNLAVFAGAFGLQWGLGAGIQALESLDWTPSQALHGALATLWCAQAVSFAWFARPHAKRVGAIHQNLNQ